MNGNTAPGERPPTGARISYEDLYRRWERGNWNATELDFAGDRSGWASLSDIQHHSALWMYSMFLYGEDAVTDNLSPYIDAAPLEEQKYFLATQQVDEARHTVFFARFFRDVIGVAGPYSTALAATLPRLNRSYRRVFERLDRMADELRADRSLPRFAQAIALYHLVVEAAMAQPGQHYIEDYFTRQGTMPSFAEGMRRVAGDEERHIAFGVKVLADCFAETDECKAAVAELLREVLPHTLGVFAPPQWDLDYTRCWGFELEEIYAFAMRSLDSKWEATGYPLAEMPPDVYPLGTVSPEARARDLIALLRAGVAGEPHPNPDASLETQAIFFKAMASAVNHDAANGKPVTIQWRFTDAEPWHLRIAEGTSVASRGEAPKPDLTLRTSWRVWVEIAMHGADPTRAILGRKVRPRGNPIVLLRMQRLFPRA